jgi:hypothetical protein
VIKGVLLEQLIAEPHDLRLVGDVTGMAGDQDAGRGCRVSGLVCMLIQESSGSDFRIACIWAAS